MSRFNLDAIAGQSRSEALERDVRQAHAMAWADPNSLHYEGKQAAQLLAVSRDSVAKVVGTARDNVAFLTSTAEVVRNLVSKVRPSAVLYLEIERQVIIDQIAQSGFPSHAISVTNSGQADLDSLKLLLAEVGTGALVFTQWANKEVGAIQDLAQLGQVAHAAGSILAVDATAALGYVPLVTSATGAAPHWDYLFADSAAWAGSRVATVFVGQTGSPAPDTTSVAEAATAAVTLETLRRAQPARSDQLAALRVELEDALGEMFSQADLVDPGSPRLPHVTTFSLPYVDAEALAVELDRHGVAVGSGSACANDVGVPSHVLAALGVLTQGNVRISLPIDCERAAIDRLLALLPGLVEQLGADITAPVTSSAPAPTGTATTAATAPHKVDLVLDERGQLCPHPVIELARAAQRLGSGATVGVLTDDPAALSDVPAWVRLQNAELVTEEPTESRGDKPATQFIVRLR